MEILEIWNGVYIEVEWIREWMTAGTPILAPHFREILEGLCLVLSKPLANLGMKYSVEDARRE